MAFDAEQRRAALREFMEREELNVGGWEVASTPMGEGTLRKFLTGETQSLTEQSYGRLADGASKLLERNVTIGELQGYQAPHNGSGEPPSTLGRTSPPQEMQKANDQPVTLLLEWKLAFGDSGRQGAFVLSNEVVGAIARPDEAGSSQKAFYCKLLDNANGPGYRAGHTIVVDPSQGPIVGDLCIFTDDPTAPRGCESIAAIFVEVTATHWIVTQSVIQGPQNICRKTYPQAWPVIVHLPRGGISVPVPR